MRHRLIHGYAEVRLDLVWAVAQEHLGPLISALEPLIPEEGASSGQSAGRPFFEFAGWACDSCNSGDISRTN